MPYTIMQRNGKHCVVKKDDPEGHSFGCHDTKEGAVAQIGAIESSESSKSMHIIEQGGKFHVVDMMGDSVGSYDTREEAMMHMDDEQENDEHKMISFKQDSSGHWWFIGIYSNKFKDRQDEILSEESHKDFVEWVSKNGVKPQVTLLHQPKPRRGFWSSVLMAFDTGLINKDVFNSVMRDYYKEFAIAETERLIYSNGFTVVVAKVHENRIPQVNRLKNSDITLGMSHGFVPLKTDGNIYERYRSFEFSVLPLSRAANAFTETHIMEVVMEKEDKKWLDGIQEGLGEAIEQATESKAEELIENGTEFKEEVPVEEVAKEEVEETTPQIDLDGLVKALNLDGLIEAIKEQLSQRDQKIESLETRIKELEKDEDTKVASLYQPNWQKSFANPLETPVEEVKSDGNKLAGWDIKPSELVWGNAFNK
jgi:hypothetical protein